MAVEVKQLNNEPIVIATIYEPVDMATDPALNRDQSNRIARKFSGRVYRITDFSNFELTFSQLVQGLAEDLRHTEPNIVHLFVGRSDLVRMQADAMKQQQYGNQDVYVFGSLDEAIRFARTELRHKD